VLADLGATVDKLEDTGAGDYLRAMPPSAIVEGEQRSAAFELLNVGKRSAAVDLKDPDGRALFLDLAGTYDVVLESFRPGVLDRLGCGPRALLERHPKLVVVSLTGFGSTGPDAHKAGHDLGYLARAGVLGISGPAGAPPAVPGVQMADVSAGLWAVVGVLAALRDRDRSGRGQHVDVSLFESAAPFGIYTLAEALLGLPSSAARGEGPLTGGVAVYGTYATGDGRAVAFAALEPKFLGPFFADHGLALELHVLAPGPHQAQMRAELTRIFASKSAAEWRAYAAARDVCLEVVATPEEWRDDPQRLALAGDRDARKMPMPLGAPAASRAPRQGEHTAEVLAEAGVDDARVAALRARGVVR
jgi:crotonobetainyl-CoA:carnitine CoA-transferase CaiB-like acyl-CoA transferase